MVSFARAGITSVITQPGGTNTQIQYNDSGKFGGSSNMTYTKASKSVSLSSLTVSGTVTSTSGFYGDGSHLSGISQMRSGTSYYIQNTGVLQSGATFFVSSGTVMGEFHVKSVPATGGITRNNWIDFYMPPTEYDGNTIIKHTGGDTGNSNPLEVRSQNSNNSTFGSFILGSSMGSLLFQDDQGIFLTGEGGFTNFMSTNTPISGFTRGTNRYATLAAIGNTNKLVYPYFMVGHGDNDASPATDFKIEKGKGFMYGDFDITGKATIDTVSSSTGVFTKTLTLPPPGTSTFTANISYKHSNNAMYIVDSASSSFIISITTKSWDITISSGNGWASSTCTLVQAPSISSCTIRSVNAVVRGGTSLGFQLDERYWGSLGTVGTSVFSGPQTATTSGVRLTSFSNAHIAPDAYLVFTTSATPVQGAVEEIKLKIYYTIDP